MHRGRNRSRKPVEIPTPASAGGDDGGGGAAASVASIGPLKCSTAPPLTTVAGGAHFTLSGPSPSIDLLHLDRRYAYYRTYTAKVFIFIIEVENWNSP